MFLHQPTTNTVAHGMSSTEESKYRYWDADPELLQDPFDVLRTAIAVKEEKLRIQRHRDLQLGHVSMAGIEMVGE